VTALWSGSMLDKLSHVPQVPPFGENFAKKKDPCLGLNMRNAIDEGYSLSEYPGREGRAGDDLRPHWARTPPEPWASFQKKKNRYFPPPFFQRTFLITAVKRMGLGGGHAGVRLFNAATTQLTPFQAPLLSFIFMAELGKTTRLTCGSKQRRDEIHGAPES